MRKNNKASLNPEALRSKLLELLIHFEADLQKEDLRLKVLTLVDAFQYLRQMGIAIMPVDANIATAARNRILLYFQKYTGQIIHGDEILVISGIQDYPRRIRELRVQFGWPISSGVSIKQMIEAGVLEVASNVKVDTDCYILLKNEQDKEASFRWNLANSIRKEPTGGKQKILAFLRKNVQVAISGDELRYVTNDSSEWARRVRELRTEEGWPIRTKQTGRPDLPQGVYVLEEDKQAEVHDRQIPDLVQVAVLERDKFQCRKCGWQQSARHPNDPRQQLELHHIQAHVKRGENNVENLITLCNTCHDEVHRKDKNNVWHLEEFNAWLKTTLL